MCLPVLLQKSRTHPRLQLSFYSPLRRSLSAILKAAGVCHDAVRRRCGRVVIAASAAAALTQAGPGAQTPTTAAATKKPASQNKAGAKPAGTVESGPCQIGVVAAIDDEFAV